MDNGQNKSPADDASAVRQWSAMAGIGIEFVCAVVLFAGLGWWLDKKFETSPWLVLVGCLLGFAVGLYTLIRAGNRMMKS